MELLLHQDQERDPVERLEKDQEIVLTKTSNAGKIGVRLTQRNYLVSQMTKPAGTK